MSKLTENLTKELKERKIIYGSKVSLKQLKKDNVEKVYLAIDCSPEIEKKLKEGHANIVKLEITKEALKDLCKVPFNVSVISVLKQKPEEELKKEQQKQQANNKEKTKEEKHKKEPSKKESTKLDKKSSKKSE